ncbi:hypothetical protein LSH36_466g02000 [Paralvinella palmiformis]|uniref:Uncharacterized protein n=1 Tax=Paralvinella palmiformis TaxID=53620 RepID=A0AAD9JAR9_9ANNE|nr:hypothetical protein LSH36_466g02000 [Paralvinella palmiformis]
MAMYGVNPNTQAMGSMDISGYTCNTYNYPPRNVVDYFHSCKKCGPAYNADDRKRVGGPRTSHHQSAILHFPPASFRSGSASCRRRRVRFRS